MKRTLPLLLLLPLVGCAGSLTRAADEGRVEDVMAALPPPGQINKCRQCPTKDAWKGYHFESTLLGCAARKGHVKVVKALLEKGASGKDGCGHPAITLAAEGGSVEVVKLLLAAGADPNVKVFLGRSPLTIAAQSGNADATRVLLEAGANIEWECYLGSMNAENGFTPLMWAVRSGNADVTRVLLEYCADDRHKSKYAGRRDAHGWARKIEREDLVQLLESYPGKEACLKQRNRRAAEAKRRGIADLENAGIDLAREGRLEDAIEKFAEALDALGDNGPGERRSRINERIFKAAAQGKLPVSDEAKRFAIRAQAIVKGAKSDADLHSAVAEFKKAVRAAPWWPEAYFNLALIQEKAGLSGAAIRNLKLYLAARPGARDAEAVNRKIIELELNSEKTNK